VGGALIFTILRDWIGDWFFYFKVINSVFINAFNLTEVDIVMCVMLQNLHVCRNIYK